MELFSSQLYEILLRRLWRRRGYQRLHGKTRKKQRVARLGGRIRRVWRVRSVPKLRLRGIRWPMKMLAMLQDAYVNTMLVVGARMSAPRRPKCQVGMRKEFESRLILEICRSVVNSRELPGV